MITAKSHVTSVCLGHVKPAEAVLGASSDIYKTNSHILAGASYSMSEQDNIIARLNIPALDERLYDLTDEERSFFKQQTGIRDDDELKAHIIDVQAEAYKVCNREPLMEIISCLKTGFSLPLHPHVLFRKVST